MLVLTGFVAWVSADEDQAAATVQVRVRLIARRVSAESGTPAALALSARKRVSCGGDAGAPDLQRD